MRIEETAALLLRGIPQSRIKQAQDEVVNSDKTYWNSASLAIQLMEDNPDKPKSACQLCAGLVYNVAGSTIRDRVRVSLAVPVEMREEIAMPASFWREAVTGTDGDEFKLIENVTQIMEHRDAYGALPSIDTVRGWSSKHNGLLVWKARLASLLTTAEKIIHDELTPKKIAGFLRGVIEYLKE